MSKNQASSIQALMYPNSNKIDKKYLDQNLKEIKKIQNENRTKREEKENFIPSKYYVLNI